MMHRLLTTRSLAVFGLLALLVVVFFFDVLLGDNVLLTEDPLAYKPWGTYAAEEDTTEGAGRVDCLRDNFDPAGDR